MKIMLRKIIVIIISFVTIGMMGSCEDIFNDLAAATAHNVCVMNTPGQNSNAVAELAFGMMVMAVRNFYNGTSGTELMGKKLGIHAYGNVGRNVARIAKGFGMDIYAFDKYDNDPERSYIISNLLS
jgi:lactate dehydrogenase-like 2-hydroxyacid dehydrogenase